MITISISRLNRQSFFKKNKFSRLVSKVLKRTFILFSLQSIIYNKYFSYKGIIDDKLEILKYYLFSNKFNSSDQIIMLDYLLRKL